MANLYGVANAPGLPSLVATIGGANINCPAGTNTPVFTSPPLIAPSTGYFYALVFVALTVQNGATAPTGFTVGAAIGAGSASNLIGIANVVLNAGAFQEFSLLTFTVPSQTAWQGLGATVSAVVNPIAQPFTVINNGSGMLVVLLRAPDQ